jgi:hypothetical protein
LQNIVHHPVLVKRHYFPVNILRSGFRRFNRRRDGEG